MGYQLTPEVLYAMRQDAMRKRMDRIRQILGVKKRQAVTVNGPITEKQSALIAEYRRLQRKGGVPTGGERRRAWSIGRRAVAYDGTFELCGSLQRKDG
jgi:alcohol dehydrogenase class IV